MSERSRVVLLVAVAMLVYGNSLLNGFTMDDRLYIFINPAVTAPSASKLFSPNEATAVWRPVTFATFALNLAASGEHSIGYHLVNWLLHAGLTTLLYLVLRRLLETVPRGRTIAFVAALLFAVHPVHVEAVASVVGRAELLAAGFVLAAWLFHLQDRWALASVCFVLALWSKESALALPLLVVAGDCAFGKLRPLHRYIWVTFIALVYVPLLWVVQGGRFGPKEYDFIVNPLAALPGDLRILNALRIAWRYVGLLIYPATLSCDYSYNAIPLYAAWRHFVPAVLATSVVLAVWIWALWTKRRAWFLAGSMYLGAFAISGNILMAAGPPMGERIAYLPSAGFCLFAALLWASVEKASPKLAGALLLIVLAALSARTWVRNRDWRDNATLFFAGVRAVPGSVKMRDGVVGQLAGRGDWNSASTAAQVLLQMYPPFPEKLKSAGIAEYDFRLVKEAERHWNLGETDDALGFVNVVIKRSPKFSLAWSDRAAIRFQRGEAATARADAQNAVRLDPTDIRAKELLGLETLAPRP
jgi:protein O-mannosyl-transferase